MLEKTYFQLGSRFVVWLCLKCKTWFVWFVIVVVYISFELEFQLYRVAALTYPQFDYLKYLFNKSFNSLYFVAQVISASINFQSSNESLI